jgi:NAD dependent epimerase/dehydratase family enzyme
LSWIHVQDLVGAVHHILKNDLLQGPVNVVSSRPVTNADFTKTLASVLSRPAIFPMPAFAARLAFGQMADELLLSSQRVEPAKLVSSGYPFQYSDLRKALEEILKG